MSSLAILIVNWNSGPQLAECLASLPGALDDSFRLERVIVVDNASTDGSAPYPVSDRLPLQLIANRVNRGFAAACNQAAARCTADYLLFLNPDTRLSKTSLRAPIAFMEEPANADVGTLGVQLADADGVVSRTCARALTPGMIIRRILGLDRLLAARFPSHVMTDWEHGQTRDVDHVTGAFFLVRRELFRALGGFDERFFVYLEDLDFSVRSNHAGWRTCYLASTTVFHKSGGSSEQIKAERLYYSLRSRIFYASKHFTSCTATAVLLATVGLEFVTRLVRAAARRSIPEAQDTCRAYALLWRALPTIARTAYRLRQAPSARVSEP